MKSTVAPFRGVLEGRPQCSCLGDHARTREAVLRHRRELTRRGFVVWPWARQRTPTRIVWAYLAERHVTDPQKEAWESWPRADLWLPWWCSTLADGGVWFELAWSARALTEARVGRLARRLRDDVDLANVVRSTAALGGRVESILCRTLLESNVWGLDHRRCGEQSKARAWAERQAELETA